MARIIKAEQLEVLHPELKTMPRVVYKNLYRFSHCFIGGSVAVDDQGVADCAADATVCLLHNQMQVAEARTDSFGDFKFDHLPAGSGNYSVVIELPGCGRQTVRVPELKTSVSLGTITFTVEAAPGTIAFAGTAAMAVTGGN